MIFKLDQIKIYFLSASLISVSRSLSLGPEGAAATGGFILLLALIIKNNMKAIIRKLIIVFNHFPHMIATSEIAASPSPDAACNTYFRSAKSTPPKA